MSHKNKDLIMATPVQTKPTQNANESKVKKTSKKRQLDEDEADYTIDTPGARDITASKRGSCHTAVAKLKMSGKMAKNDMMRKDTVQGR